MHDFINNFWAFIRLFQEKLIFCILASMLPFFTVMAQSSLPVMEVSADRTIIYPDRMELTGEESLLDVLLMYPDLMIAGYEDLINGYNLRMDNCPMNGDTRLILTRMKAKDIAKIQVCDNVGVSKGTIGEGRVLDINMRKYDEGTHGFAQGEFLGVHDTKQYGGSALVNALIGSKKTDLYANESYRYDEGHKEFLTLHMTNKFNSRNKLLSYFTQQYVDGSEKYMGRARFFHTFNDMGTELLLVGGYQYATNDGIDSRLPLGIVELNTPLFTKDISFMLGWEGEFLMNRSCTESLGYDEFNNDFYVQVSWKLPGNKVKLTAGERVMLYNYRLDNKDIVERKHNDVRHNANAVVTYALTSNHQLQGGYYRKYINPATSALMDVQRYLTDDEWQITKGQLVENNINEIKVAYVYSTRKVTTKSEVSYNLLEHGANYFKMGTSASMRIGKLSGVNALLNGGINLYSSAEATYASISFSPLLYLPKRWNINTNAVYYTSDSPRYKQLDTPIYMAVGVNKQIGRAFDVGIQWHDIFYHYGGVEARLLYKF